MLLFAEWAGEQTEGRRKSGGLPQSLTDFLVVRRVLRSFVVGLQEVLQGWCGVGPGILRLLDCWVRYLALLKP
jgi:hypothetical protein